MLAQLPRQLSMEARLKKSQSKSNNDELSSGWRKLGKDGLFSSVSSKEAATQSAFICFSSS